MEIKTDYELTANGLELINRIEEQMKYQDSKIYKIVDNTNGDVYVGSTFKLLSDRLSGHVNVYKQYLKGKMNYITSFQIIANGNYHIELIENYPCFSKQKLLVRERYWTNRIVCINKRKLQGLYIELGKTEYHKQHYQQHKAHYDQYYQQYYHQHIARYKEIKNAKHTCECGGCFTTTNKARHFKSNKHQSYL